MEGAFEGKVVNIIGDVELAVCEGMAASKIERVVSELSGEKEAPQGKANGGAADIVGHGVTPNL